MGSLGGGDSKVVDEMVDCNVMEERMSSWRLSEQTKSVGFSSFILHESWWNWNHYIKLSRSVFIEQVSFPVLYQLGLGLFASLLRVASPIDGKSG